MSLTSINTSPRLTKHLVRLRAFDTKRLSVVDVGARGGFEPYWSLYGEQVRIIGFEADVKECDRLNQQASNVGSRYFPIALDQNTGKRVFYVTAYPSSSSFYKPDIRFWHRFPDEINLTVVKEAQIDTIDLDTFSRQNELEFVDFIKLDVEGNELPILRGAEKLLKKSVIGLSIEVEFYPSHEGQPVFSDVDSFLRPLGFVLFDLAIYRHARKVLPEVSPYRDDNGNVVPGPTEKGQVIWGQALYLRDAVNEIKFSPLLEDSWDDTKLLKLASIMEIFGLPDCAIELIQVAREKGFLQSWNVDYLIDLLVPKVKDRSLWSIGEKTVSYCEYLKRIANLQLRSMSDRKYKFVLRIVPRPIRHVIRLWLTKLKDLVEEILR